MITLLLALHNHQPVGNFEHVFDMAFKKCYWPVLNTLEEFPQIKISLHHSGPLLDWAKKNEPEYLKKLVRMIKAGQIEPLGGGYYEPILAVIPPRDAAGQLKMMREFWEKEAGISTKGIWMTERIWEPSLTTLLADNDIKYTILDDEHFRAAGVVDEFILNHHLTERHGKTTSIFASDKTLRYQIPFKLPEDVIAHLLYLSDKYPGGAVTYGDDGEKFGLWPGTHEWVIEKGWLRKFFKLLLDNKDKIRTLTLSEFYAGRRPENTVYLPTCSYHEMGEWSMPAHAIHQMESIKGFLEQNGKWEEAKPFVQGGYWDNFLTKYPESNYMHKRMLYVSEKLEEAMSLRAQAKQSPGKNHTQEIASSEDGLAMTNARNALYRAQCNCAYWHGLFGGLYLNYLRHAIFENLIDADNILDALDHDPDAKEHVRIERCDIDRDLTDEVMLSNKHLIAVIKPSEGAGLLELSHRRSKLNLRNVLARREEAYHKKNAEVHKRTSAEENGLGISSIHDLSKDPNDAGPIAYDTCNRLSFCDHIWQALQNPANLNELKDKVSLCKLPYKIISTDKDHLVLTAEYDGLHIEKLYHMTHEARLVVEYALKWKEPLKEPLRFGTGLNLTLLAGHDKGRYYLLPDGARELMDVVKGPERTNRLRLVDEYFKFNLDISSDTTMDIWRYPINTVSQSESGFDLLYQGSCILWTAVIPEGEKEFDFKITLEFN